MNLIDYHILENITFNIHSYRNNFDFIYDFDNIITECDGFISLSRMNEKKLPLTIGEFNLSIINISLLRLLKIDLVSLLNNYSFMRIYNEILNLINKNNIDITKYDKIVLIHSLVIQKEYRKHGITEEFIEMIYREYYSEKTLILALVLPFQYNEIDFDYYHKRRKLVNENNNTKTSAFNYYKLDEFLYKNDMETNEYKLFTLFSKCGFNRICDSIIFQFNPDTIINRITDKDKYNKYIKQLHK